MKALGPFVIALSLTAYAHAAEPLIFESGNEQVALVELFTSEGCSSCPPAEAWLSSLKAKPVLWKKVVPVAYHVDYWDHLGWTDRFAKAEFTERQRQYSASWGGANSIYTPGFVVNGKEWRGWFAGPQIPPTGPKTGKLKITVSNKNEITAELGDVPHLKKEPQLNIS